MPSSQTCWCCQPTTSSHPPPSQIHTHDLDDRDDCTACTACTRRPLPASARCIDRHLVAPAATPSGGLDAGRGHSGPDWGAQGLHDAMDRRNRNSNDSQRQRPRQRSNPNVFADDYALDPDEDDFMPAVSDGFRPSNTGDAWHGDRQDHDRNDASHSQFTSSKSPDGDLRRMATRNSTTKAFESSSSSALHDGRPPGMQNSHSNHHHQASNSQSSPLQHRESISSTGSFATMTRSESPFTTGPSHPYGMYPQLTAARPASISTASTQRQPQRSLSLQRPAHPYAMYSQSGIDDDQPEERPAVPQIQTSIPIGFPGLNMGYHRVIGPDGEEQDIIGPDGHTEQLPPYSRYPEEGPTKASLAAEASASRIVPVAEPMAHPDDPFHTPVSPVSPLLPPLSSVTPARLPPQRPETQTGSVATSTSSTAHTSSVPAPATDSSSASLLATEQGISEKAEEVIPKSDWRKKKLWGRIPMGVAAILLVLVLIFAIVLGAAIGTYVGKKDKNKPKHDGDHGGEDPIPQVTGPTHTLFGATPISTPAGLSPLPTGAYALPLGIPQENNPGCLTQANQYSAWSCRMTFAPLVLTVNDTLTGPDGNPRQMASIEATKRISDGTIQYGPQPPALLLQPMQLVLDLDYKAFGPAYHFSTRYDKIVVLRQDEFGAGASLRKREGDKPPPDFRTRFQVMPGDFPWFCVWNQTYIEGYIYVQDNSTAGAYLNPSPTTLPPGVSPPTSQSDSSVASQVSTPSSTTGSGPTSAGAAQQTSPSLLRRGEDGPPRTPPYPRIVKVEERRLPGSPQPYCQKMLLLDNGQVAPALNNNENPVRIYLQEDDPTLEEYFQMQPTSSSGSGTSVRRRSDLEKRVDPSNACHCQWMFK